SSAARGRARPSPTPPSAQKPAPTAAVDWRNSRRVVFPLIRGRLPGGGGAKAAPAPASGSWNTPVMRTPRGPPPILPFLRAPQTPQVLRRADKQVPLRSRRGRVALLAERVLGQQFELRSRPDDVGVPLRRGDVEQPPGTQQRRAVPPAHLVHPQPLAGP